MNMIIYLFFFIIIFNNLDTLYTMRTILRIIRKYIIILFFTGPFYCKYKYKFKLEIDIWMDVQCIIYILFKCVCVFLNHNYFLLLPRYVLKFSPYHRSVYIVMNVTCSILANTLIKWIVVVVLLLLDVDVAAIDIANKCNIIIFRPFS